MAKATSAERGALFLSVSKFFGIIAGYAVYLGLARILGPEKFGIYGVVIGVISVLNMVVIRGTLQSVSKFVSENPKKGEAIKRKSLLMSLYVGGSIFLIYELLAGVIARVLNDPSFTPYIRLAGLIFLSYSFYGVIRGYVNGMRHFLLQAILEVTYNFLKVLLVLGLAYLGYSVMGAIGGFATAAFLIFVISLLAVGIHKTTDSVDLRSLLHFNLLVMGIAFIENLLLQLDLFAVKALSPAAISNLLGGYYTAVLSIARLPYYAVISLSFVILPLISHSTFNRNKERTAKYINQVMRYSLIILAILAVLFSTEAENLLTLLYSSTYAVGAPALSIAVFGLLAYGLLYVALTIIVASGRPKIAFYATIFSLMVDVAANLILVPKYQMVGAAIASATAFLISVLICWIYMQKVFSAFIPLASLLRIGISALVVYLISTAVSLSFPFWVLEMGGLALLYGLLLLVTREFGEDDLRRVKRLIKG